MKWCVCRLLCFVLGYLLFSGYAWVNLSCNVCLCQFFASPVVRGYFFWKLLTNLFVLEIMDGHFPVVGSPTFNAGSFRR